MVGRFEIIGCCPLEEDMPNAVHEKQTDAAERFKIPLSTLNQKIKRLQIDIKRCREA